MYVQEINQSFLLVRKFSLFISLSLTLSLSLFLSFLSKPPRTFSMQKERNREKKEGENKRESLREERKNCQLFFTDEIHSIPSLYCILISLISWNIHHIVK